MTDTDKLRPEVRDTLDWIEAEYPEASTIRTELLRLAGEVTELRALCAATYQAAGCYGLPERFKDALSNAATGERIHDVDVDNLCPVDPVEWVERAEKAEAELAALKDNHRGLLVGTTHDGRPYGLHGTHESVSAVSDELEELAALKARIADGWLCGVSNDACPGNFDAAIYCLPSRFRGKLVRLLVEE